MGQKCGAEAAWDDEAPQSQEEPRGTDPCGTRKKRMSKPTTQETPTRDRCRAMDRLVLCFGRCVDDAPRARPKAGLGEWVGHCIGLDAKSVREKTETEKKKLWVQGLM